MGDGLRLFFDLEIIFLDDDFDVADVFEDDFGATIAGVVYLAVSIREKLSFAKGADGHAARINSFFQQVFSGVAGATLTEFYVVGIAGARIGVTVEFDDQVGVGDEDVGNAIEDLRASGTDEVFV